MINLIKLTQTANMGLFSLKIILGFVLIAVLLITLHLRKKWYPKLRDWVRSRRALIRPHEYHMLPSFEQDIANGLSSEAFDVSFHNKNDTRKGLEDSAKREILKLMNENPNISFDEARLQHTRSKMAGNGISADGIPLDPKTVTFNNIGK